MSRKAISGKIKNSAVSLYLKGNTIADVSKQMGVGYESVRRWIKEKGHDTSKKSRNFYLNGVVPVVVNKPKRVKKADRSNLRWTSDEDEILRDAVIGGMTVSETSDLLARSKSSIYCRKLQLIGRGVIVDPNVRFSMPDDIKRPRVKEGESVIEDVIEVEDVSVKTPVIPVVNEEVKEAIAQDTSLVNIPELSDLAKIVKDYGVNVTLNLSGSGVEVTIKN